MVGRRMLFALAAASALLGSCFGGGNGEKTPTPEQADGKEADTRPAPAGLSVGTQSSLGQDTVIYWSLGCFACGRPEVPNLYRRHIGADGKPFTVELFAPMRAEGGYPVSFGADWGRGDLWVVWCRKGSCGGEGDVSGDAVMVLMRSQDGGVTWNETGIALERVYTTLAGADGGQVTVARYPGGGAAARYTVYPGAQDVTPPNADPTLIAERVDDLGTIWLKQGPQGPEGPYVDGKGQAVLKVPGTPVWRGLVEATQTRRVAQWQGDGTPPPAEFGVFDGEGKLQKAWRWEQRFAPAGGTGQAFIDVAGWLDDTRLYGTVLLSDFYAFGVGQPTKEQVQHGRLFPIEIAIFDLETNTVHPMIGFSDEAPMSGAPAPAQNVNPFVVHVETGPVKRVNAPNDCANVRDAPSISAGVLGCYRDGVLLKLRSEAPRDAEGRNWTPVSTPDGRAGWVATEFLN